MVTTIHDVARRARVSVSTVSRAFGAPGLLRDTTLERVLAAAKQLDYRPNPAAQSLITGRTGNIGIVVPDLENPFYPSVLRGVQMRAHEAGYAVLLADSAEDPEAERHLVRTMAKQVDGVIICAPFGSNAALRSLASTTRLVLVNRQLDGVSAVLMDMAHAMEQVVTHLVQLGHRRIAFLGGPSAAWSNRERLRGVRALRRKLDAEVVELGPFEPKYDGGIEGADAALALGVTAIVAYNDLMALGVLSRLHALGVRVPADVSVAGFDNVLYADMCAPPLTTVAMPMAPSGRLAVELLLGMLEGSPRSRLQPQHPKLSTELIVRGTTGPVAPRARN